MTIVYGMAKYMIDNKHANITGIAWASGTMTTGNTTVRLITGIAAIIEITASIPSVIPLMMPP